MEGMAMLSRCVTISALALATIIAAPLVVTVGAPTEAAAAPAPVYPVGARLKAKRDCSLQGFAIKKGVVLTVAAVSEDGKSIDLQFSGMTISGVQKTQVASLFQRV
jgi:hypothetical protein